MITSIYNRLLFKFAPLKLIKRYTGKKAHRMYFIREYELAYTQIWRAEFFREQKKELREDIRREYDKASEVLELAKMRLNEENQKENPDKAVIENLEKGVETKKTEIKQFQEQIDHIDTEIKGYTEALESLRITLPLVEKYIAQ